MLAWELRAFSDITFLHEVTARLPIIESCLEVYLIIQEKHEMSFWNFFSLMAYSIRDQVSKF